MGFIVACLLVLGLLAIAYIGAGLLGMTTFFGVVLPYVAFILFLGGVVYRIWNWGKSPVPFNITTTCGQAKSLDFIKSNPIETPTTKRGLVARMFLEVVFFRSLFRNTRAELTEDNNLAYQWEKWLWIFAILFHWGMFFTLLRHFRFFTAEVPAWVTFISDIDGVIQIDLHPVYITGFMLLGGVTLLLLRRLYMPKVRYISLLNDYFPLMLLIGIALTGMTMHYVNVARVDVTNIRELMLSLVTFQPLSLQPGDVSVVFYMHLTLVCTLLIYFPWSKLMHAVGIFMSPTRNMTSNSREVRHVNPWNPVVEFHTYMEYEDEYRDKMIKFGLPVEKTLEEAEAEQQAKEAKLREELG